MDPRDAPEGRRYELSVQFRDMEEDDVESIMAYVFRMQRDAIREQKKKDLRTISGRQGGRA